MVQWLRLHASIAGAMGYIHGRGTKIHVPHGKAQKEKRIVMRTRIKENDQC